MKKIDAIIFDMDGVLVTNDSYNQAIIKTVDFYMQKKMGRKIKVTTDEIYAMKQITGFNNDWDLSFALIQLLKKSVKTDQFTKKVKKIGQKTRKSTQYNKMKDIFQCFYLGEQIFQQIYKRVAPFSNKKGLIQVESLLIEIEILKRLSAKYKLAIATSRPRFEAIYGARYQKISPRFIKEDYIVAKEDCAREKPFPDPLFEAQKRIIAQRPVYIGDTINDVIAAKKAGMPSIYIGKEKIGDYQLEKVDWIERILL